MKELRGSSKDVLLEAKAKFIHMLVFPSTAHTCKNWIVKTTEGRGIQYGAQGEVFRDHGWLGRQTSGSEIKSLSKSNNGKTTAVVRWTHHERSRLSENIILLGKVEDSRRRR